MKNYHYEYINCFKIMNTKKWFKIKCSYNDLYVFIRNRNEFHKLYRISNEYNISKSKDLLLDIIDWKIKL